MSHLCPCSVFNFLHFAHRHWLLSKGQFVSLTDGVARYKWPFLSHLTSATACDVRKFPFVAQALDLWILVKSLAALNSPTRSLSGPMLVQVESKSASDDGARRKAAADAASVVCQLERSRKSGDILVKKFYKARTCYIEVAVTAVSEAVTVKSKDGHGKLEGRQRARSQKLWFSKPPHCDYLTKERTQDVSPSWTFQSCGTGCRGGGVALAPKFKCVCTGRHHEVSNSHILLSY